MKFGETKAARIAGKVVQAGSEIMMDAGRNVIAEHEIDAYEHGKERQLELDIHSAIKAFLELKQNDTTIMDLLSRYFGVDSISEAQSYIRSAKIVMQYNRLKTYCMDQGLNRAAFLEYASQYDLERKLETNPKLLDMTVEKLKEAIEKK